MKEFVRFAVALPFVLIAFMFMCVSNAADIIAEFFGAIIDAIGDF